MQFMSQLQGCSITFTGMMSLFYFFVNCDQQPDTFFCKIAQMTKYDQYGLLSVTLNVCESRHS